jgi:hypothetical protein
VEGFKRHTVSKNGPVAQVVAIPLDLAHRVDTRTLLHHTAAYLEYLALYSANGYDPIP